MPCYSWSCLFQLLCSWPKTELQVPTSDCINYNETIIIMVFIKHYIFKMRLSINLVFEIGAKENIFRMIHNHAFSQGGLASLTSFFSDIFWQKWGVFVLIRKEISWIFQNSPYFCLLSTFGTLYGLWNANHSFFWDTLYILVKCAPGGWYFFDILVC